MQSAGAFTATPALPLLKPRKLSTNSGLGHLVLCSKRHDSNVVPSAFPLIRRSWSLSSTPSSLFRPWTAVPLRDPDTTGHFQIIKATVVPESAGGEEKKATDLARRIEILLLMGLWYLFNIFFNIYNKQVLKVYRFPVTVTTCQFGVGTVLVLLLWTFNFYRPKVSGAQFL